MEAAGLVVGIVALYTACQSCYHIYSNTKDATEGAIQAARELEIHKSILKSWAFYWGITPSLGVTEDGTDNEDVQISVKLEQYLKRYPDKSIGIVSALQCIADALSDKEKLLKSYGLEVDINPTTVLTAVDVANTDAVPSPRTWKQMKDELKRISDTVTSRITVTRKVVWALKDVKKFKCLIDELKRHNDSLHVLGPEWASELLQISLALEFLPRYEASDLKQMRGSSSRGRPLSTGDESPTEASSHLESGGSREHVGGDTVGKDTGSLSSVSPSQQGLQVLADLADIKIEAAMINNDEPLSPEEEKRLLCFKPEDLEIGKFELDQEHSQMAALRSRRETVYLEQHSYGADDEKLSKNIRTSILKLGRLLKLPGCSKHLHALKLLGMVDLSNETIGLVYELPSSLGKPRKGFPIEDMVIRKPQSPVALVGRDDLGWRFGLARKLVQSVAFLHACGWLHKNIRINEFVFFPKSGPILSRDREHMDFENPFLLGYRYSRPDRLKDQEPTQSEENPAQAPAKSESPDRTSNNAAGTQTNILDGQRSGIVSGSDSDSDSGPLDTPRQPMPKPGSMADRLLRSHYVFVPNRVRLDFRHHPYKRAYPDRRYCYAFDVYSLGIVLLELGLWRPVDEILSDSPEKPDRYNISNIDPFVLRRSLVERAQDWLPFNCGTVYTNVTVSCLSIDAEDSIDNGLMEQRSLCARIAADLAQCQV